MNHALTSARRWLTLLTAVVAVFAALAVLPPPASADHRPSRHCSESGDVCTQVRRNNGVRLRLGTFSFTGRYRLCVVTPGGERTCERFRLVERDGFYQDSVRWARHFPHGGPGAYRVIWRKSGNRISPVLGFHIADESVPCARSAAPAACVPAG